MSATDDTFRKVRAYAAQPGAGFTTTGVRLVGRVARLGVVPAGGVELLLTAAQCEAWLSGYLTGRRREVEVFRDRSSDPRYGDQTACALCGSDIEYGSDGWRDRGGVRTCAESGAARWDGDGVPIPFPAGVMHCATSDVVVTA